MAGAVAMYFRPQGYPSPHLIVPIKYHITLPSGEILCHFANWSSAAPRVGMVGLHWVRSTPHHQMATRSRIGIQLSDESILSVYHHSDGYPQWLGRILRTHYNSKDLATELIDGGDMSCCWTDRRWDNSVDGSYGPQYYSQRGEDCPPRYDLSLKTYLETGEEYAYLYTLEGEWVCYDRHEYGSGIPERVEIPALALAV